MKRFRPLELILSLNLLFLTVTAVATLKRPVIRPPMVVEPWNLPVASGPDSSLFPERILEWVPTPAPEPVPEKSKPKSAFDKILGGGLAGKGKAFETSARKHGIPASLLVAICLWETGNGKSEMLKDYRNPAGNLKRVGGKWQSYRFDTVEDGIEFTASNLSRNYWSKGLRTVSAIRAKYAPTVKKGSPGFNDPKNLNSHWVRGVTAMMQKAKAVQL